jgi:hypothetical protein
MEIRMNSVKSQYHARAFLSLGTVILSILISACNDSGLNQRPKDDGKALVQAKNEWNSRCINCHFVPDNDLRTDRVWVGMIRETA